MGDRVTLSDASVARLPFADGGQYIVRDRQPGFFLVVGKTAKTFTVQVAVDKSQGRSSKRLSVGRFGEISTRDARAAARKIAEDLRTKSTQAKAGENRLTLGVAWEKYRVALERKGRSPRTIEGYAHHVATYFVDWIETELSELASNPGLVARRHDDLTAARGAYAANGGMRTLRAIFNHGARTEIDLRGKNPVTAVDFNREHRRQTALDEKELQKWYRQLNALPNPIRREFHLLSLLTGSRPDALSAARWSHVNLKDRVWHFPKPKGGSGRAFDIPISRAIMRCLIRARAAGRRLYPIEAVDFIFPADTVVGHIVETRETRKKLCKFGNDLRQTFRTFGVAAGVGEISLHILMNHKLKGVSAGYINLIPLWPMLLADQKKISDYIFRVVS